MTKTNIKKKIKNFPHFNRDTKETQVHPPSPQLLLIKFPDERMLCSDRKV